MSKRLLVSAALFVFAANAQAAENFTTNNNNVITNVSQATINDDAFAKPEWRYLIGNSHYKNDDGSNGNGLSFNVEKTFWDQYAIGGSMSSYNVDSGNYVGVYGLYGTFTPIEYSFNKADLWVSALAGVMHAEADVTAAETFGFVGAAIEASYNGIIGIRADQKLGSDIERITSVSLIGYY